MGTTNGLKRLSLCNARCRRLDSAVDHVDGRRCASDRVSSELYDFMGYTDNVKVPSTNVTGALGAIAGAVIDELPPALVPLLSVPPYVPLISGAQ